MNIQPIEKRVADPQGRIDVHSVFRTIQGEGPFTGQAAVFIRLAGCNLQCPACDTDYTVGRKEYTADQLVAVVDSLPNANDLVVITGGEPFRQDIERLVALLITEGYRVQIETNGSLPPPSSVFKAYCKLDTNEPDGCFIVCSPKAGKVNEQLAPLVCAYKYVIRAGNVTGRGLPITALEHTASPHVAEPPEFFTGPIYVQPCDEKDVAKNQANLNACIDSVMKYGYTLQLQVHKIINME